MKIVVLGGGLSPEREVSMSSASKISKALANQGHKVLLIDVSKDINNFSEIQFSSNPDDFRQITVNAECPDNIGTSNSNYVGTNVINCCKTADVTFIALHGGIGENGKLQALLDLNNIKYTGTGCEGCMLSMNKNISKTLSACFGVLTSSWSINKKDESIDFPCVVKPSNGGSSIGVSIVNNEIELNEALNESKAYDDTVIVEKYIQGREVSVGILNGSPLPVIEIIPDNGFYDYKNKYQQGLTREICPASLPMGIKEELQKNALKIHKILHLGYYSRIDFIIDKYGKIYFLEANALPGMTPSSLLPQEASAAGISYEKLCLMIASNPQNTENKINNQTETKPY